MTDDNIADKASFGGAQPRETREDRLAAKLRENLRRRKVQARAQRAGSGVEGESSGAQEDAQSDSGTLSKPSV